MDFFIVPTLSFDLLYAFVIIRLDRRALVWIGVTRHPTAEWVARQITEAFPWDEAPRYLLRDRDCIYGASVKRRLQAMGIRDKPIAPASPWQNAIAERLIGSIRRECVDHLIVLGEAHLRQICSRMRGTITKFALIGRWARTRPFPASFSGTGPSDRSPLSAGSSSLRSDLIFGTDRSNGCDGWAAFVKFWGRMWAFARAVGH